MAYRDPSEYEEYQRLEGNARAEVVLSVANGPQTALIFPAYRLQSLTRSWTFNRGGAQSDWGTIRYLSDGKRPFAYAPFVHQVAGTRRHCMAFLSAWGSLPDDPMHHPGKALFGYYCAPPKQSFDMQQAVAILRGIRLETADIPVVYFGQHLPNDPRALQAARGQGAAMAGNPEFPFYFSHYYTVGGRDDTLY